MNLYHYTTGQKLPHILDSGYLIPSSAGGSANEKPLLWFSKSKDYEPTALKMVSCPVRGFRTLTKEEQRELAGNVRFRLKGGHAALLNWRESCKAAEISTKERKALEAVGMKSGANPKNWFSTLNYVSLAKLDIEVETDNGWQSIEVQA